MLGNHADSSSAVATFVGYFFLCSVHSLFVYNISFLGDLHVCGQRNSYMFSKRSGEHIAGDCSLFVCLLVILIIYWKIMIPLKREVQYTFLNGCKILFTLFILFNILVNQCYVI